MRLGTLLRVWYSDDNVWHERVVLLEGRGPDVFSPDDDVYQEDLGGAAVDGPEKVREIPYGTRTRYSKPVYKFRVDIDESFIRGNVRRAWEDYVTTYGVAPETDGRELPEGGSLPLSALAPGKSRRRLVAKGPQLRSGNAPAGQSWRSSETRGLVQLGDRLVFSDATDVVLGPNDAAFLREGKWLRGEIVEDSLLDDWISVRQAELGHQSAATGEQADHQMEPMPKEQEERDLRILPVLFDSAEERWRTLSEAVPLYEEVDFDDFPLQGPRTMHRDVRQLRRMGMDFVQHHESWIKTSGVRATDRSVHEHASICRVLNFMASYDQLNIVSLASAETLNRGRALIEVAHQGRPEAPSYESAEDIMGVRPHSSCSSSPSRQG
ncbi:unnamed protein product [Symbiodinium sp. CCMP2592]|nr:unnamed protein product [Symbiodinium sp. CCMP2592]